MFGKATCQNNTVSVPLSIFIQWQNKKQARVGADKKGRSGYQKLGIFCLFGLMIMKIINKYHDN